MTVKYDILKIVSMEIPVPWRWGHQVPLKVKYLSFRLQSVTSPNTVIFISLYYHAWCILGQWSAGWPRTQSTVLQCTGRVYQSANIWSKFTLIIFIGVPPPPQVMVVINTMMNKQMWRLTVLHPQLRFRIAWRSYN